MRWHPRMTREGSRNPNASSSVSGTNPTLGRHLTSRQHYLTDIGNGVVTQFSYIQVQPKTALARFDLRFLRMDRKCRLTYNAQHSTLITCSSSVSSFQCYILTSDVAVVPTSDSNETPHLCMLICKREQPKPFPRPTLFTNTQARV